MKFSRLWIINESYGVLGFGFLLIETRKINQCHLQEIHFFFHSYHYFTPLPRLTTKMMKILEQENQRSYGNVAYDENHVITRRRQTTERRPRGYKRIKVDMDAVVQRSTVEMYDTLNRDFWRCAAKTVDRLCFVLLGFIFVFLTTAFLLRGYGQNVEDDDGKYINNGDGR